MSWRIISEKFKHIPHLGLDFKVPLEEILNEMNSGALDFERIHLNLALRNEPTKNQTMVWPGTDWLSS